MLRDVFKPARNLIRAISVKQRIWLLVISLTLMLVIGGVINLAPWFNSWVKLGIFVLIVVFAICFLLLVAPRYLEELQENEISNQHNEKTHIPPKPSRQPKAGVERLSIEAQPIKLSAFARRRITKQQPILKNSQPILEQRISKSELFVQLEKRRPTGKTVKRFWAKKPRPVLEPRKTIWAELLWCIVGFIALAYTLWLSFSSGAELNNTGRITLIALTFVFLIVATIRLYIKLAYWYFWRLLLFRANEKEGVDAKAVIIDKPFLIPGGSVPSVDLRILRLVSSSTARAIEDERSLESILAGWLDVEWLLLDTYGQGDARFNWMGPFRNAPMLVAIFDHERRKARLEDK